MATQALFDIGNVFLEPTRTFARLKTRTHAWLPLLILILLSCGVMYWWIVTVDFDWLREHMLSAQATAKPEAREAMGRFLTPTSMMWMSGLGIVIGTVLLSALAGLYYLVAGKALGTGADINFGKWFGFAVWVSMPRLLAIPLSILQILTSNGQLAQEDLNMVSLNYLLFHLPASHPWVHLVTNIELTSFWSIALAVFGLKAWTGRSTGTCVTVAVLPYLIVYGLWAAKIAIIG